MFAVCLVSSKTTCSIFFLLLLFVFYFLFCFRNLLCLFFCVDTIISFVRHMYVYFLFLLHRNPRKVFWASTFGSVVFSFWRRVPSTTTRRRLTGPRPTSPSA